MMFGFKGVFARKPRQFEYRPRYYDPEKEAREKRRNEILGPRDEDMRDEKGEYVPGKYIKNNMMVRRGIGLQRKQSRTGPLRLVIVLALLGLAAWWLLS